jgi:hypothetical protein
MKTSNLIRVIILLLIEPHLIWTYNLNLSYLEDKLLYSHLHNTENLDLFYKTLIQSNGVDDGIRVHDILTDDNLRQNQLDHKVTKASLKSKISQGWNQLLYKL